MHECVFKTVVETARPIHGVVRLDDAADACLPSGIKLEVVERTTDGLATVESQHTGVRYAMAYERLLLAAAPREIDRLIQHQVNVLSSFDPGTCRWLRALDEMETLTTFRRLTRRLETRPVRPQQCCGEM